MRRMGVEGKTEDGRGHITMAQGLPAISLSPPAVYGIRTRAMRFCSGCRRADGRWVWSGLLYRPA